MKYLLTIILLMANTSILANEFNHQIILQSHHNKTDLYTGLNLWLSTHYKKQPETKIIKDKEDGTIISNGLTAWDMAKVSWMPNVMLKSRFKLKIDLKDNKYRLTFSQVGLDWVGDGLIYEDIEKSADRDKNQADASAAFAQLATQIDSYLKNYQPKDDW